MYLCNLRQIYYILSQAVMLMYHFKKRLSLICFPLFFGFGYRLLEKKCINFFRSINTVRLLISLSNNKTFSSTDSGYIFVAFKFLMQHLAQVIL